MEIDPNNTEFSIYAYRGITYIDKGEYDLAIADFTEAVKIKPSDIELIINLLFSE